MTSNNLIAFLAATLVAPGFVNAITIDMVTVGNPGNAPDMRFSAVAMGSVPYSFQIGKYEITVAQYAEFLNSVAKEDANGLYDERMENQGTLSRPRIQIHRSGSSPNYTYTVSTDWANRPINYVSFWNAARFANWLHNGQPVGPQGPGTTEDGAYINIGDQDRFARKPGARFFIPTHDEWYKAAYHKNDGASANYWNYPTRSNAEPSNVLENSEGYGANYWDFPGHWTRNSDYTIGSPYFRTEVGAFYNSPSSYGTFDQGGNVWEWNETSGVDSTRFVSGGAWDQPSDYLLASTLFAGGYAPWYANPVIGFRVASIPIAEPSCLCLLTIVSMALGLRRQPRDN